VIELPRIDVFFIVVLVFFVLAYVGIQRLRVDPPANDPKAFMKTRASRPEGPPRPLAVCAGDSITRGAASVNYVDMLASRLPDWDFVNAGVNSELAYNLALRLDPIIELQPEAVTILIGSNDVNATFGLHSALGYYALQRLPERPNLLFYTENLTLIVRRLKKETKARIALLSLPPIGEEIGHAPRSTRASSGASRRTRASNTCPSTSASSRISSPPPRAGTRASAG
jgi:lysophospholipase L1-like esterase